MTRTLIINKWGDCDTVQVKVWRVGKNGGHDKSWYPGRASILRVAGLVSSLHTKPLVDIQHTSISLIYELGNMVISKETL